MVRLAATAALLIVLAALQGAGLLFPRDDRARELCDDRRRLESAVSADGRSDNATPAEAARLLQDYVDRLVPCRTGELEIASTAHAELVAIAAGSYVRRDDNLLRLVTGRISWKARRGHRGLDCFAGRAVPRQADKRHGWFRDIRRAAGDEIVPAGLGRSPAGADAAAIGDRPHGQDTAHDVPV